MGDNRVFNVNGRSKNQLIATIKLAMLDEYDHESKIKGWRYSKTHGLIFLWYLTENQRSDPARQQHKFPIPLKAEEVANIAWDWLQSDDAKVVPKEGWDADADHDGSNELGWRIYCEDWGHVESEDGAVFAIKPAYMWYGK